VVDTSILLAHAFYHGFVTYILLPAVMLAGLLLTPIGMFLKVRREHLKEIQIPAGRPKIDQEEPHHRHAFFIYVVGTGVFVLHSGVGSYEAF